MEISTEGVLILASAKALANEYKDKEFDYAFPEGFQHLLDQQVAIALQTSDCDELVIEFTETETKEAPDHEIIRYIRISPEDELLVLSHADFTMICNGHHGDYASYGRALEKVDALESGLYEVKIKVWDPKDEEEFDEDEEDDYEYEGWFFRLSISMKLVDEALHGNDVIEINE